MDAGVALGAASCVGGNAAAKPPEVEQEVKSPVVGARRSMALSFQSITLAILAYLWTTIAPGAIDFPSDPYGGGIPDPASITHELFPAYPSDIDDLTLIVTPSTSQNYTGTVQVDVNQMAGGAVYSEILSVNSAPAEFAIPALPAGDYSVMILFIEDGAFSPNATDFYFSVSASVPSSSYSSSPSSQPTVTMSVQPASGPGNWAVGAPVNMTFFVENGTGTYTFMARGLPSGVTVDEAGLLSGTPTEAGEFSVAVGTQDAEVAPATFTWTIFPPKGSPPSSSEPPPSSSEPPPSSSEPPPSSSEPPPSSSEPPPSSSEPPPSSSEPPYSSSEPPYSSSEPPYSSSEPPYSSSEEPVSSESSSSSEPASSSEEDDSDVSEEPSDPSLSVEPEGEDSSSEVSSADPDDDPSDGEYSVATRLVLKAAPRTVVKGKTVRFTASVTTKNGKVPSGYVTFKVDGKSVTAIVRDGIATYSMKTKKTGKFKVTAKFNSTSSLKSSSDIATYKVKKKKSSTSAADAGEYTQILTMDGVADLLTSVDPDSFDFITTSPVSNYFAFAPDQVQMSASLSAIQQAAGAEKRGIFDVWVKGSGGLVAFPGARGIFGSGTLGGDVMFNPDFIGGLSLTLDTHSSAETGGPGRSSGLGWLVAPYLKGKIGDALGYGITVGGGGVTNQVSPVGTYTDVVNGTRWLVSAAVNGDIELADDWHLSPVISGSYIEQRMQGYVSGSGATVGPQTSGQAKIALSPSLTRTFILSDDGTSLTVGTNVELAVQVATASGAFGSPELRLGAGLDLSIDLPGGARLTSGLDLARTQSGITSFRGTIGLAAELN